MGPGRLERVRFGDIKKQSLKTCISCYVSCSGDPKDSFQSWTCLLALWVSLICQQPGEWKAIWDHLDLPFLSLLCKHGGPSVGASPLSVLASTFNSSSDYFYSGASSTFPGGQVNVSFSFFYVIALMIAHVEKYNRFLYVDVASRNLSGLPCH